MQDLLPEILVTNLHHRYTGVSATIKSLVPHQRLQNNVAVWDWGGLGLGGEIGIRVLLRLGWSKPKQSRWRIWHARRDNEILIGLIMRSLLRQPWKLVFTSAAPKKPGWWLRQLLKFCDAIIATSPRSAKYLNRCDAIIFHGVDCKLFQPLPDREPALAEVDLSGKQVIAAFGRIRPSKGTDLVVQALISLLPVYPDWVGVITGHCKKSDQEFMESLVRDIDAAGLAKRIIFVGDLNDSQIGRWYQRATICVAASRREGFGLTPLEAMASGCVPVTSHAGAWPWIINSEAGELIETGSKSALVNAIEKLIVDPLRLNRMAASARELSIKSHSIMNEARDISKIYNKLLE